MKKSQVLAALALAFALGLGVVAPVANTYAITFTDNGKVVEGLDTKIKEAITNAKDKCGYRYVDSTKTYYYDSYEALVNVIDDAADEVADTEAEQVATAEFTLSDGTKATGLTGVYAKAIVALKGDVSTLPAGVDDTVPAGKKSYSSVVEYINGVMTTLNKKAETVSDKDADEKDAKAYRTAADELKAALETAEDNIDKTKEEEAAKIQAAIAGVTDEDVTKQDAMTYAEALKAANGLSSNNGFTTVAKVRNLMKAIERAEDILASKATEKASTADELIAAINKALGGGTVTDADLPNKPADGNGNTNNGLTTPDTGALVNSDNNATSTVAMVAGVATALTAAGAGVVAYRNARRSTRK